MPTKELERVPLPIANGIKIEGPKRQIALSRAALEESTSDRVVISCKCKGLCNSRRCRCFKEQKKCSVHCHGGDDDHDCGFLASLELRTEKALVSRAKATGLGSAGLGPAVGSGPGPVVGARSRPVAGARSGPGSRKRARANTAGDQVE